MRLRRPGPIDVAAAVVVLFAVFFPAQGMSVESAYVRYTEPDEVPDRLAEIARAQAELAARPSGVAADELSRILEQLGQHDMALRVAGEAVSRGGSDVWRAHLAISSAHAERIEIEPAHEHGARALEACRRDGAGCPPHDEVRLRLYVEQLHAGLQALQAGIDPRLAPHEFRQKIQEIHPTATGRRVRIR
jgi:hypothetical protein